MKPVHAITCLLAVLLPAAGRVVGQGFSPEEAVRRMRVADGLAVNLVASEPMVRKPVSLTFDDRGRMWVIQYLQYPAPAGLKPVKVDQYLRTVYDRIPEPPPKGPKGADRITILYDPDEQGRFRQSKDFLTGLNLCTGMAIGHGGVFVMQAPYLLFYPVREGEDVPAGDPEVLLEGFGMEDAHALANSLQWGPDGWLYGAQGSTVTAKIRGIEFQQGIWRYHPRTKVFELFAEGGGNTWGLDFDRHGNAIAGTNFGGFAMLHQVQGGYYIKGFGKHGPLHNPYTFGYFDHVPHKDFKGGHVTCGGIVYQGDSWPARFRDSYVAANLLSNALYWHTLTPRGSSFRARQAGDLLVANDTWFRPVDCLTGPDGALYVADWSDQRANHVDPVDNWDRSRGRIYRIQPPGKPYVKDLALAKIASRDLVALLDHPNSWQRGEARRLLAERRDATVLPLLRQRIRQDKGEGALEALWALNVSGGLGDEAFVRELLAHANPDVRAWTVRLLGNERKLSAPLRPLLVDLARSEPSATVRSQLACSAKRWPAVDGLTIVRALLERSEDVDDPHLPLLLWWAIEDKAVSDRAAVLALFDSPSAWKLPLVRKVVLERLGRRYLAEGGPADLQACSHLLEAAPGSAEVRLLVSGMERALDGRTLRKVPEALLAPLDKLWSQGKPDIGLVRLGLRLGYAPARTRALAVVADQGQGETERVAYLEVLGQEARPTDAAVFLAVMREGKRTEAERGAALAALQRYEDPAVAAALLETYARLPPGLKSRARDLLLSRKGPALALLRMVDAGTLDKKDLSLDQLRGLARFQDAELTKLVEKHYGRIGPQSSGEKVARLRSVAAIVSRGKGDPGRGRDLFKQHCGNCHQLFGEGSKIGPDLMTVDRRNRDFLLLSIIDPSAVIRPEYVAFTVALHDGRELFGLITEEPTAVTVLDARNQRTVVPRKQIEELRASAVSLMPEKLLDPLTDQQICDLIAYVQGDRPK